MKKMNLSGVIAVAMQSSVKSVIEGATEASFKDASTAMFSMESLIHEPESVDNITKLMAAQAKTARGTTDLAKELIEGQVAAIQVELQMNTTDPDQAAHDARIQLATQFFGSAWVSQLEKEAKDQFPVKLEAALLSAGEVMSETALALKGENAIAALTSTDYNFNNMSMESINGYAYDDETGFSLEHFDKFDVENNVTVSMMLSAMSTVEAPVVRMNYPMYRLPAGGNKVVLTIEQEYLIGNDVRPGAGKAFRKQDTPLIESYFETNLWEDNRIDLIPVYDDTTKSKFIDPAISKHTVETDELGKAFQTNFLRSGVEIDLITVAAGRGEIKGNAQDRTDQLSPSFRMGRLAVQVKNADGSTVEAYPLNVEYLPTAISRKDETGGSRSVSVSLNEANVSFPIANLKTLLGTDGTLLDAIATAYPGGLVATVTASLPRIDLTEATSVFNGTITITGAYDSTGKVVPASDDTLKPLLDAVSFEVIGFKLLDATRTDTNYSNQGKMIETQSFSRPYKVGFSPRIMARSAIGTTDASDARMLDSALRKISREKVIKALMAKYDRLMAHTDGGQGCVKNPATFPSSAFGNCVTIPTLYQKVYIPTEDTLSRTHAERMADARAHLIGNLRTLVTFTTNDSRLKVVAKDMNKGIEDIKVCMTVDPRINQLLMVEGDDRLLTTAFKNFEIVEDEANEVRGKIIITYHADTPYDISPISNGIRAVGISPVVRFPEDTVGTKKANRTFVQPRELILDTNDIMSVLVVEKLEELMTIDAPIKTQEVPA